MADTRRSFLSRIAAGTTAIGAALGIPAAAAAQSANASRSPWEASRHAEDDWFDVPAKHRLFLDTSTVHGLGMALRYAENYFTASRSAAYGLADADSAVILGMRHESTPFAFSDAMWAKYGEALGGHAVFVDPKTKVAPVSNLYQAAGYNTLLVNKGIVLDTLIKRGVRIAVCQLATRATASEAAQMGKGTADDIYKELVANLIPNARLVPAGIVALNRAQERGYSIGSVA